MTGTSLPPRRFDRTRRVIRWLAPGALLALVPKCGLCVLGYLGLGALLGLGGPELCGARQDPGLPLAVWVPGVVAAASAVVLITRARRLR